MKKEITNSGGILLNTAGKYCAEDITVGVKLQNLNVTSCGSFTADDGFAGLGKVNVNVAGGSGGVPANIVYSQTQPSDNSKLWIASSEPSEINFNPERSDEFLAVQTISDQSFMADSMICGASCVSFGKMVYTIGGKNSSTITKTIAYDFFNRTKTVNSTAKLWAVAYNIACAKVGDNAYLFGGDQGVSSGTCHNYIYAFNLSEGSTIRLLSTALPNRMSEIGCAAVGNKIYLFGGRSCVNNVNTYCNTIIVFDTNTETLSTLPVTLPHGMSGMSCAVVGKKIYLLGGVQADNSFLNTVYVFDTETNNIALTSLTLADPIAEMACAKLGNNFYLLGGLTGSECKNYIQKFDPEDYTITTTSATLPEPLRLCSCSVMGDTAYLIGGINNQNKRRNTFVAVTLTFPLENGKMLALQNIKKNKVQLFSSSPKVNIGVEKVFVGDSNGNAKLVDAFVHDGTDWKNICYE